MPCEIRILRNYKNLVYSLNNIREDDKNFLDFLGDMTLSDGGNRPPPPFAIRIIYMYFFFNYDFFCHQYGLGARPGGGGSEVRGSRINNFFDALHEFDDRDPAE